MKFVFEVHIKPGFSAEQYAQAWVRASEIIQQAPGARGTRLHRKLDDPNVLLAIAEWDSQAARNAAGQRHDPYVDEIIRAAAQYCQIRVIGEFDEPEWVVMPKAE